MTMPRIVGIALAVVGVILLVWGIQAADSFASDVSETLSGTPTDRSMWLIIGGAAALVVGGAMAAFGGRRLSKS